MTKVGGSRILRFMNLVRTHGVVLRAKNRNEADRLLTVLSPELGKILVLSKGCRKPKSRFLAFSQLFCYGELIMQPYREIYILNQAEVKNSFYDIRNDMDRLYCATYIANLTEEVATIGEDNAPLFALLLQGLSYLSYGNRNPLETTLIYELKLMELTGYKPNVTISPALAKLGGGKSGVLDESISIHSETAEIIQEVLESDHNQAQEISMSEKVRQELNKVLPIYIRQKLDLKILTRSFLDLIP
ncbi:MAG: DNA repair protein RecO [Clostridiales bacterium]|nr:DNA repair protein RecO [Clostridiales bacterium]